MRISILYKEYFKLSPQSEKEYWDFKEAEIEIRPLYIGPEDFPIAALINEYYIHEKEKQVNLQAKNKETPFEIRVFNNELYSKEPNNPGTIDEVKEVIQGEIRNLLQEDFKFPVIPKTGRPEKIIVSKTDLEERTKKAQRFAEETMISKDGIWHKISEPYFCILKDEIIITAPNQDKNDIPNFDSQLQKCSIPRLKEFLQEKFNKKIRFEKNKYQIFIPEAFKLYKAEETEKRVREEIKKILRVMFEDKADEQTEKTIIEETINTIKEKSQKFFYTANQRHIKDETIETVLRKISESTDKHSLKEIKKGDRFFVNPFELHTANCDAYLKIDKNYKGYAVDDENNNTWLEDDFIKKYED